MQLSIHEKADAPLMDTGTLYSIGIALIFAGTLIILATILLILFSNIKKEGKTKGGGAIIIGPIPIIFGTDKESTRTILLLSIMLTILLIILMITFYISSK